MRAKQCSYPDRPTQDARGCRLCALTRRFLGGTAKEFLKSLDEPASEKRLEGLSSIMHKAREISLQLWGQRTGVQCLYKPTEVAEHGFMIDSKDMIPHDTMAIAPSNHALDKKEVTLVVEPAIVTYIVGRDGIVTPKRKVWAKAVVWVDDWEKALPKDSVARDCDPTTTETTVCPVLVFYLAGLIV